MIYIVETKKAFEMKKIYNFSREMKSIKEKPKPPKLTLVDSTYIGTTPSKKPVYISDNARHVFICGTTGSGKTVAISNFIKRAVEKNYPLLVVDGKGDSADNSILDITRKLTKGKEKLYVINLNDPECSSRYNPFQNCNTSTVKDMLISMTEWSEEHYKLNTERYLQRVVNLMQKSDIPLSFSSITRNIPTTRYMQMSYDLMKDKKISKDEHLDNCDLAGSSGKIAESAAARFATLAESELGPIFDQDGIDIYTALHENAVILFVLNPLLYPVLSPEIGKLALIDAKKAVSKMFYDNPRAFFIFDEISSYASMSLLDLVNKSRSANVTNILATQSLSDLDMVTDQFKEQIIENCNNYIVLRQNSSTNAENWAKILGTRGTLEVTYQLQQQNMNTNTTGFGSAKRVREFLYHPDDIKRLDTGKGIFMSKDDNNYHTKITINKPF